MIANLLYPHKEGHILTPHEAVVDKSWIDIGRGWLVLTASYMGDSCHLNAGLLQQIKHTDRSLTIKLYQKVFSAEGHIIRNSEEY